MVNDVLEKTATKKNNPQDISSFNSQMRMQWLQTMMMDYKNTHLPSHRKFLDQLVKIMIISVGLFIPIPRGITIIARRPSLSTSWDGIKRRNRHRYRGVGRGNCLPSHDIRHFFLVPSQDDVDDVWESRRHHCWDAGGGGRWQHGTVGMTTLSIHPLPPPPPPLDSFSSTNSLLTPASSSYAFFSIAKFGRNGSGPKWWSFWLLHLDKRPQHGFNVPERGFLYNRESDM